MARGIRNGISTSFVGRVLDRQITARISLLNAANWTVLRSLITSPTGPSLMQVACINTARSSGRILYDGGFLVTRCSGREETQSALKVYSLNGVNGSLRCVSTVHMQAEWKDRDFAFGPVGGSSVAHRPCLYYISSSSLHCLDLQTGAVIEVVNLPNKYRYTSLYIDHETETLAVSSVKNSGDIIIAFALYDYRPLKYVRLIEVSKSVYGKTLFSAQISQGLLLTMHSGSVIKVYSLSSPSSPVLLQVTSFEHQLCIGASPFCFIVAEQHNMFSLRDLQSRQSLHNSTVECAGDSFDSQISFHPDESSRFVVTDSGVLTVYDIVPAGSSGARRVTRSCSYGPTQSPHQQRATMMTSSGRRVRSVAGSQSIQHQPGRLLAWDYEDDMELLGIVFARETEKRGRETIVLERLDLIDSRKGQLLRTVPLGLSVAVGLNPPEILLRLDAENAIISISKGQVQLLVYRFTSR